MSGSKYKVPLTSLSNLSPVYEFHLYGNLNNNSSEKLSSGNSVIIKGSILNLQGFKYLSIQSFSKLLGIDIFSHIVEIYSLYNLFK